MSQGIYPENRMFILRLSIYVLIFFVACFLRFQSGFFINLDLDSAGYLNPAMDAIYKKEFVLYTRSYAYPFFSMISILVFKNINSILFIQHLLSISSLLVAFWLLEKNLRSLKNVKIFWLQFLFATAFLLVCFWNGSIILFEKTLRPEGLTLFSFSLLAFLFYGYIQKRNQGNLRASSRLFFILFFCLFFMSFLHSRMTLGFYSVGIYLFICHGYFGSISARYFGLICATFRDQQVSCLKTR